MGTNELAANAPLTAALKTFGRAANPVVKETARFNYVSAGFVVEGKTAAGARQALALAAKAAGFTNLRAGKLQGTTELALWGNYGDSQFYAKIRHSCGETMIIVATEPC